MKECRFCGMPLEGRAAEDICDYCKNDEHKEMLSNFEEDEDADE